jgi:tetratricopeptide (TPR) repeat protein
MNQKYILLILSILTIFISCKSPHERSLNYIKQGNELERNSDFAKAQDIYRKAIDAEPSNATAWFYLGNAKRNMGMTKESVSYYNKAIELDSTFADAYANRGDAKFSLKDREGSCRDYLKAEALGKENMDEKTKWCK